MFKVMIRLTIASNVISLIIISMFMIMFMPSLESEEANLEQVSSSTGFIYPVAEPYKINATFMDSNYIVGSTHYGVDFAFFPGTENTIFSSSNGTVISTVTNCSPFGGNLGNSCGGYLGNHIKIETEVNGVKFHILYGHLSQLKVAVGDEVVIGQKIGIMGNSGNSSGAHLHFEMRKYENGNFTAMDPLPYLRSAVSSDKVTLMKSAGINVEDYEYVDFIITHESSWSETADNPTSSAYGLCQALPGNKMASAGSDWKTNPETQMKWCNDYAIDRYGTWEKAYNFWKENSWW